MAVIAATAIALTIDVRHRDDRRRVASSSFNGDWPP